MYFLFFALLGAINAAFFIYIRRPQKEAILIFVAYTLLGVGYERANEIYQYAFIGIMAILLIMYAHGYEIRKAEYFIRSLENRYDEENGTCYVNLGRHRTISHALTAAKEQGIYKNSCLMKNEGYGLIYVCTLNREY